MPVALWNKRTPHKSKTFQFINIINAWKGYYTGTIFILSSPEGVLVASLI